MAAESITLKSFRLLDKTSTRDRLCRVVQYASKFISWLLEQEGIGEDVIVRVKSLESSISTARKLFRIGKSFDQLRVAFLTISLKDPVLRVLITLGKITRFLFLLLDHLVWAGRVRLLTLDSKKWTRRSAKFWFLAILLGILRDMYEILVAVKTEKVRLTHDSTGERRNVKNALTRVVYNHPSLMLDLVKNCMDIFLPLSNLDVGAGLSPGLVGVMGVASSVCSLITIWNESLKLKYS